MTDRQFGVPLRYSDFLQEVAVDMPPIVQTPHGLRSAVGYRWKCLRCGQLLRRNTAGAQSHLQKHIRQVERAARRAR